MEEYEATIRYWQKVHPQWLTRETRGFCAESLAVYLLKITDGTVPDEDKQVCLVTALHSGPERTGATGVLAVIDWLLGDSPEAAEVRRKQIVLAMPVVNPLAMFYTDTFGNSTGVDPYTGNSRQGKVWNAKTLSLTRPAEAPELAAFRSVVDEYHPEVHADLHGIGLQELSAANLPDRRMERSQMMTEITGSAYSNYALRPWDWRITDRMIAAARAAGFPSDRFEADAQRTFTGPELAPLGKKLWRGAPFFYSAHYGYAKYHTMMLALEVAWEESAVARMRALFEIGNKAWDDERTPGYPVNRVKNFVGQFVTAYGATASERRRSRVELWNKQENFAIGFLYPQTVGRASLVCALSAKAKEALKKTDLASVRAQLPALIGSGAAELEQFLASGPEPKMAMDDLSAAATAKDDVVEHGIGFRLRISDQAPKKLDVRLNGEQLTESATDGYEAWPADGFTQVQVNVPPAKAQKVGLFFITCGYEPSVQRTAWSLPAAVREQCRSDRADATPPTLSEIRYGTHFRQTLDLWLAKSEKPSPLVIYFHGGGWAAEDKSNIHQHLDVERFLKAGISVAAVNYRLLQEASAAGVKLPIEWPLGDCARAVQFLRQRAPEWRLDSTRFAGTGVSAGGIASLWLAFHDDMADSASADAVARQSTRLFTVAAVAPPTSLDPRQMREWIPNSEFGGHPFGFLPKASRRESFEPFLAARDSLLPQIERYSPYALASADDPAIFLEYAAQEAPPVPGTVQRDPSHSAIFGIKLQERLRTLGVQCELHYPGGPTTPHADAEEYLLEKLRAR